MNTTEKGKLIGAIVAHLKYHAIEQKKQFSEGDTFFKLCFMDDKELLQIAKLTGI